MIRIDSDLDHCLDQEIFSKDLLALHSVDIGGVGMLAEVCVYWRGWYVGGGVCCLSALVIVRMSSIEDFIDIFGQSGVLGAVHDVLLCVYRKSHCARQFSQFL